MRNPVKLEEAVLAIAAARDSVDRLDIVWLADDELKNDGQTLKNTKGQTPIDELADLHVDICRLDYVRLGKVANRVNSAIKQNRFQRLKRSYVKRLLTEAVGQGRIDLARLQQKVQAEVQTSFGQ